MCLLFDACRPATLNKWCALQLASWLVSPEFDLPQTTLCGISLQQIHSMNGRSVKKQIEPNLDPNSDPILVPNTLFLAVQVFKRSSAGSRQPSICPADRCSGLPPTSPEKISHVDESHKHDKD